MDNKTDSKPQGDVLTDTPGDSSSQVQNSTVPSPTFEFNAVVRGTLDRLGLNLKQGAAYYGVPETTLRNWLGRVDGAGVSRPARRLVEVLAMIETMAPDIHAHLIPKG